MSEPAQPRDWRLLLSRAIERRAVRTILAGAAVAFLVACGAAAWWVVRVGAALPDRDALQHIADHLARSTIVYDDLDRPAFTIFAEQRTPVPLSRMSPNLVRAVIAVEDQRFFEHHGVDLIRTASALLADLHLGRLAQGGSTITQQLARQSFLTSDKTFRRKAQELILALRLERRYSKTEILELYLNTVYFGDGLYGAEAASRGYFGVSAADLSVDQAALLAGLIKAPSAYAPTTNPDRAVARRNLVLGLMADDNLIDGATSARARRAPLSLRSPDPAGEATGLYFKEAVRRELIDRFGESRVYDDGMRVFTTVDMAMQASSESVVKQSLDALDARRRAAMPRRRGARDAEPPLQAALIAIDPASGDVRAMVGGRDFDESSFNRAVQAHRQPGSAFKPFVYAAALEAGLAPSTVIADLNDPIETPDGDWMPADENLDVDSMSLRAALRISSNRAAAHLLQTVGINRAVDTARRLGVGDLPSVPSLALGSGEVTLQSLTAAYAAFANHGRLPRPRLIRRVEDTEGHVLFADAPSSSAAVSDVTAFLLASMLADVVNAGTGSEARRLGFTLPAAGKTGTTNGFRDAWFVGFTPKLVAGVWVGFDEPRTILPGGFAAGIAVPIWARFMKAATKGEAPEWFAPPRGVTAARVCRLSGQLATPDCDAYTDYFAAGTAPTAYCDLHSSQGLMRRVAAWFGRGEPPAPPGVNLPPPAATAPPARAAAAAPAPPPPSPTGAPPRRGFFARLFGLHRKDKSHSPVPPPKQRD